ncbi:MAG TPA: hypothetical protein VJV23_14090 [Candidatus Polarisedimenticolia bacterium]|nr:hypothetical protein [Candidatus Polarisedimenticolia bacterium]
MPATPSRRPAPRSRGADLPDVLSAIPERRDLERLFDRNVPLQRILRLATRQVPPGSVGKLLESPHFRRELDELLSA